MFSRSMGQQAFEAYVKAVEGKDVRGGRIPPWDELSDAVQQGWESAAKSIASFALPANWKTSLLDDRQRKELEFAEMYATHFRHGTDGHHRLMLINKLRELMELYSAAH